VTLRARWVTLRARWLTLRARWVTLRARWVTLRARWVTLTVGARRSYVAFEQGSVQYRWLQTTLANVNRSRTPWVFMGSHAPW
jgi:hypothetical protein